jgi:hypothetical protein
MTRLLVIVAGLLAGALGSSLIPACCPPCDPPREHRLSPGTYEVVEAASGREENHRVEISPDFARITETFTRNGGTESWEIRYTVVDRWFVEHF